MSTFEITLATTFGVAFLVGLKMTRDATRAKMVAERKRLENERKEREKIQKERDDVEKSRIDLLKSISEAEEIAYEYPGDAKDALERARAAIELVLRKNYGIRKIPLW